MRRLFRPSRIPIPNSLVRWRPSLRSRVVVASAAVVVAMALVVSDSVANHLRQTATGSALRSVEAIVRGYVDPVLHEERLDLGGERDPVIDDQLARLSLSGDIRLINVWSRDGAVAYSSLPGIRDRRFSIGPDLARAFAGESFSRYASSGQATTADAGGAAADPILEGAIPPRYLQVFVPIRGAVDGNPIGVYEVFQDAAPIEDRVEATRRDVFLAALAAATVLFGLLWLATAGASRRLARQNRLLRQRAAAERLLAADLRRSEERFRSLVRSASDVILLLNADGTIAYESPGVERVLGYPVAERIGRRAFESLHPDDVARGEYLLAEVLASSGAEASAEFLARHADGSWRVLEAVAKNLVDDPAVGGVVVNYRDVSERKALEEQLRHQAFHDGLTALANRALFSDRLEHALARRSQDAGRLAVLFIDLDDFKTVNDTLGHVVGDRLLVSVADRIRGILRPADTAARMGGDEFAVLLDDTDGADSADLIAERILVALRRPHDLGESQATAQTSIGIARAVGPDDTAEELLRNADLAMYLAKSQGKDRVVTYEPGHGDVALGRLQLKADLHQAFERGEFWIAFQPIVELDTHAIVGLEALLRWKHPRRGQVSPVEFIPLAEESGLIVPLGRWVLREACRNARTWEQWSGRARIGVSVNLSARQLDEPGFLTDVERALVEAGLEPSRLTLEITESLLMRDVPLATSTLEQLRRLGVRIAIDDFGTGYSSLSYLRQFPVDTLKIDRSFVATLGGGVAEAAVVSSILRLASSLDLVTVAEGIEDAVQLGELRSLGARLGQGFYFARPLEPEAVAAFIRDSVAVQSRDVRNERAHHRRGAKRSVAGGAPARPLAVADPVSRPAPGASERTTE